VFKNLSIIKKIKILPKSWTGEWSKVLCYYCEEAEDYVDVGKKIPGAILREEEEYNMCKFSSQGIHNH
jgi:hypothetical protein